MNNIYTTHTYLIMLDTFAIYTKICVVLPKMVSLPMAKSDTGRILLVWNTLPKMHTIKLIHKINTFNAYIKLIQLINNTKKNDLE